MRSLLVLALAACGRLDFAPAADARDIVDEATPARHIATGMYVGTATDNRRIDVGFAPVVVFLKRDSNNVWGRLRTSSMVGDNTKLFEGTVAAGAVTSLGPAGFTVSAAADVNGLGLTYYWIAFPASPDLAVGSYTGNGIDDRTIDVGFSPALVITAAADLGLPLLRSSTMPPDSCHDVDATERANAIQAMVPTGFQLGSDMVANAAGKVYHYVAFAPVPGKVATGTYTGDGTVSRSIDDTGFSPEWVLLKRVGNVGIFRPWVHRPAIASGNLSLFFADFASVTDMIQMMRPLGFQIGMQPQVNEQGRPYHWIAFGN
jgi:hypothetical protein